jgi:hypothetical protein
MAASRTRAAAVERQLITIAFAGYNRDWADWIGKQLEHRGHEVVYHRWDVPSESTIEESLSDLLLAGGQVLLIFSGWFFQLGPRNPDEWNRALREFVAPNADSFAAVSVDSASLPSAATVLRPAELWGMGANEAERRLLKRLQLPISNITEGLGSSDTRFPEDEPDVWGGVPGVMCASLVGRTSSPVSTASSSGRREALPSAHSSACPVWARRRSPLSTSIVSRPPMTSSGGFPPTSGELCVSGSQNWRVPSESLLVQNTESESELYATRCVGVAPIRGGFWFSTVLMNLT